MDTNACACELSGFCAARNMAVSAPLQTICKKNPAKVDRLLGLAPPFVAESPQRSQRHTTTHHTPHEAVGTALKARIEGLLAIKAVHATCGCQTLATEMDRWGIAGCESRREEIVGKLVGNRDMLIAALRTRAAEISVVLPVMLAVMDAIVPDAALGIGANWLLTQAIEDVRNQPPRQSRIRTGTSRHQQPTRKTSVDRSRIVSRGGGKNRSGKPYTGWRSEADGPRIEHGPFVSSVRHLTYHVWAASHGDSWQWNLQQVAKRWSLFNGKRIIAIAEDKTSAPADEVIEFAQSLGLTFDHHVIRGNKSKLREVVTWIPMLELLSPGSAAENEVVFSAHAKGQYRPNQSQTHDWARLMYESCLDDWPTVYDALRSSLMAGSFREYGLFGTDHNWAYSGTFFWWRLAEIGKRNWRSVEQAFCGTEKWPGRLCDPRETACLFLNDSKRMYDRPYWESTVWPRWAEYQEALRVSSDY